MGPQVAVCSMGAVLRWARSTVTLHELGLSSGVTLICRPCVAEAKGGTVLSPWACGTCVWIHSCLPLPFSQTQKTSSCPGWVMRDMANPLHHGTRVCACVQQREQVCVREQPWLPQPH